MGWVGQLDGQLDGRAGQVEGQLAIAVLLVGDVILLRVLRKNIHVTLFFGVQQLLV